MLVIIAVAVALGVTLSKKTTSDQDSSGASGNGTAGTGEKGGTSTSSATSGKAGSQVTTEDGTTFVYNNDFGGDWASDPKSPFAAGGKAQGWSPRIGSEDWVWGEHTARGVNLGYVLNDKGHELKLNICASKWLAR